MSSANSRRLRILVLGPPHAGKTSLVSSLCGHPDFVLDGASGSLLPASEGSARATGRGASHSRSLGCHTDVTMVRLQDLGTFEVQWLELPLGTPECRAAYAAHEAGFHGVLLVVDGSTSRSYDAVAGLLEEVAQYVKGWSAAAATARGRDVALGGDGDDDDLHEDYGAGAVESHARGSSSSAAFGGDAFEAAEHEGPRRRRFDSLVGGVEGVPPGQSVPGASSISGFGGSASDLAAASSSTAALLGGSSAGTGGAAGGRPAAAAAVASAASAASAASVAAALREVPLLVVSTRADVISPSARAAASKSLAKETSAAVGKQGSSGGGGAGSLKDGLSGALLRGLWAVSTLSTGPTRAKVAVQLPGRTEVARVCGLFTCTRARRARAVVEVPIVPAVACVDPFLASACPPRPSGPGMAATVSPALLEGLSGFLAQAAAYRYSGGGGRKEASGAPSASAAAPSPAV